MHSIFGWSYPPGCNGPPDYDEGPCEICGEGNTDYCICPECHECGSVGDPYCYIHHGLRRTEEQKFSREIADRIMKEELEDYWEQQRRWRDESIFEE